MRLAGDKGSLQAAAYDRTFRSDEEAVSYHYAARNDHLPDFDNPTWVNEKIRWQFLNHPNPLMQIAADKVGSARLPHATRTRRFCAPELLRGRHDARGSLLAADLPERFVLKSASGWAQNRFVDDPAPEARRALASTLAEWELWDHWRFLGELHYRGIPKRWLAEEVIGAPQRINEYKFYCLMGEPQFFMYMTDRTDTGVRCSLFDTAMAADALPLDRPSRRRAERPERVPAAFEKMLAEARRLSEDFMHVRVDFLEMRRSGLLLRADLLGRRGAQSLPAADAERGLRRDDGPAPRRRVLRARPGDLSTLAMPLPAAA